jgi:hypothetical protein
MQLEIPNALCVRLAVATTSDGDKLNFSKLDPRNQSLPVLNGFFAFDSGLITVNFFITLSLS